MKNRLRTKISLICIILLLIISIFTMYQKYYKKSQEINKIENNNISTLAYTVNGVKSKGIFPTKESGYTGASVTCENGVTASWDNSLWGLVDINMNGQKQLKCIVNFTVDSKEYTTPGSYTYTPVCTGTYKLEVWGAQGGNAKYTTQYYGGLGGFVSGNVTLNEKNKLYVYVGGMGISHDGTTTDNVSYNGNGYNGGGSGVFYSENSNAGSGGGATDIRLTSGDWNNFNSLKSRVMVAGGGGGADSHISSPNYSGNGGAAGGLIAYESDKKGEYYQYGTGGNQTTGGLSGREEFYVTGGFGFGGTNSHSGGGSGYYGGGSGYHTSAAGGSSFISGYSGCDAIAESSTENNIVHTGQPNHYSGKVFTDGVMIDGKGCNWSTGVAANCGANQPQPDGTNAVGHTGDGYARITLISCD